MPEREAEGALGGCHAKEGRVKDSNGREHVETALRVCPGTAGGCWSDRQGALGGRAGGRGRRPPPLPPPPLPSLLAPGVKNASPDRSLERTSTLPFGRRRPGAGNGETPKGTSGVRARRCPLRRRRWRALPQGRSSNPSWVGEMGAPRRRPGGRRWVGGHSPTWSWLRRGRPWPHPPAGRGRRAWRDGAPRSWACSHLGCSGPSCN